MKKIIVFSLLFTIFHTYNTTAQDKKENISTEEKVNVLMSIRGFICLSKTLEEKYFDAMPDSFSEFKEMYSHPWKYEGETVWLSFDFNSRLKNLYYINKEKVLSKLFEMSKDGHWEDSPVVDLQMIIQQ